MTTSTLTTNIVTLEYDEMEEFGFTAFILNRQTGKALSAVIDKDCDRAFDKINLLAIELGIELESEDFDLNDGIESIKSLPSVESEYFEYMSLITGLNLNFAEYN